MSLSKFKPKKFQAVRKFTDRAEPKTVFEGAVTDLITGNTTFKVLVYYGIGGIGKTKLLNELKSNKTFAITEKVHEVFVSLDAFEFNSPTDILISIRNQLKIPTILFDYALVRYWSLIGNSVVDLKKRLNENSILWEILNFGSGLSGGILPVGLVSKSFNKLKDKYYATFSKYKDEIEEIENAESLRLYQMLPYFLGLSIQDAFERKKISHIIYFDAYETMLSKLDNQAISQSAEEWIQELIGASEVGLFVIGSREFIKWGDRNPDWSKYLEQHILGELSDEDAEYFLESVPIKEMDIKKEIIKTANGIPLYLDLCVSIYESKISNSDVITPDSFIIAESEVVDRFLRHLESNERELVKLLSIVSIFDFRYFSYIIDTFSVGYSKSLFDEFIKTSIIRKIAEQEEIYKVDENIRGYILKGISHSVLSEVLIRTLQFMIENKLVYSEDVLLKYYGHICHLQHLIRDVDTSYIDNFLEISLYLIDQGFWNEVGFINSKKESEIKMSSKISNAIKLISSIYSRRTEDVMTALNKINTIQFDKTLLGSYVNFAKFSQANMVRLTGNYKKAQKLYHSLIEAEESSQGNSKLLMKIKRQHADLKFLQGDFNDALRILEELKELSKEDSVEYAETLRIIGHIYRFNWLFKDAEYYYLLSLKVAKENKIIGLEGKVYTNLTELYCLFDSSQALKYAELSIDVNEMLISPIELGKTYAAMSIANINLDQQKSFEYADMAETIQGKVNYKSGILFGKVAKGLLAFKQNNQTLLEQVKDNVDEIINEIGVYHYLILPFLLINNNAEEINRIKSETGWLNFENTVLVMRKYLDGLR